MIRSRSKRSISRRLAQLAFTLAALVAVARIVQLANEPLPESRTDRLVQPTFVGAVSDHDLERIPPRLVSGSETSASETPPTGIPSCNNADAELARLYAHCPMAATVDFHTVAAGASHGPATAGNRLPPHRLTADRVATSAVTPVEPAIPRVRYPVRLRTASLPKDSTQPPPTPSAEEGDWLIDPSEWYTPAEQERLREPGSSQVSLPEPITPIVEPPEPSRSATPAGPSAADGAIETQQPATWPLPPEVQAAPAFEPPAEPGAVDVPAPVVELPGVQAEPTFASPAEPGAVDAPVPFVVPPPPAPHGAPAEGDSRMHSAAPAAKSQPGVDPHLELFAKNNYPSARECAACHEEIFHEWSVSAHAYAAVSPMFQKFEQKLNDLSQGTVGYFCVRCHAPVATALCESRAEPIWNMPEVAREGITCIACHRVQYIYGKSNGERRIEPGNVFAPVLGGIGGEGIAQVIEQKNEFKVKTSPDDQGPGQEMHLAGIYFEPLTKSEFCTPCHQVAVHPGIKLEVVWEQYRASPACKKGIQCQDCHMGRVPGLPLGYNVGPVAKVNDKTVSDHRRRSNHVFYGPNYSIAHPGIFPFHLKSNRWTIQEWLLFDWRAGWGTDQFEDAVADGQIQANFPPCWAEADDRYDAREIVDENLKKLNYKRDIRVEVMENGSHVEGPFFDSKLRRGKDLHLHYLVSNTNEGHNLLTASLGAQPQLWANVVLVGPDGRRIWETGYTDSFGDLCNIHSHDVRHHKMPYDWQLFNLQTMFLITGAKGTDREFFVPVNVDIDQLPFIRPGVQPISVINHPPFIRMESQSLAPLGSRRVPYRIPGKLLEQPGTYRLSFRMRSRAEPIYFMQFCGATEEMQRAMNEWMVDVHPSSIEFTIP